MPKQVDHGQRRRDIADAVARTAAAEGLEAVTMRRVAAEAGISTPLVQHYFPDKNTMLRFAVTELTEVARRRAEDRVRAAVEAAAPVHHTMPMLRAILAELLPIDEDRRTLLLLHLAFFARAASDPDLASYYREAPEAHEGLARILREERDAGRAPAAIEPDIEADTLVTLGVGLGTAMLMGTHTATSATELIDYHLRRLLPAATGWP